MNNIRVLDREFEMIIPSEKIVLRNRELGKQLSDELKDSNPVFVAILNGSFMFAADLLRNMEIDVQITFLKLASYQGSSSSGNIRQLIGINQDFRDENVIILEDIVDTGLTLETIIRQLSGYQPASVKTVAMLFKQDAYKMNNPPDYNGFIVPDRFLVGYGLDYKGFGRKFRDIYAMV